MWVDLTLQRLKLRGELFFRRPLCFCQKRLNAKLLLIEGLDQDTDLVMPINRKKFLAGAVVFLHGVVQTAQRPGDRLRDRDQDHAHQNGEHSQDQIKSKKDRSASRISIP